MQAAGCQRSLLSSRGTGAASLRQQCRPSKARRRPACVRVSAHRVQVNVNGRKEVLNVSEDQTILEVALEQGIELSHDCKMGVCMTCPAKLVSGRVDQTAGMLDEDVQEKGYALLCVAQPQSDCEVQTIEEEELLAEVMHSGAL